MLVLISRCIKRKHSKLPLHLLISIKNLLNIKFVIIQVLFIVSKYYIYLLLFREKSQYITPSVFLYVKDRFLVTIYKTYSMKNPQINSQILIAYCF